jgi:AcrR family transcriptional regulator
MSPRGAARPEGNKRERNRGRRDGHLADERVSAIQRARLLAAMREACGELGAANVSVTDVVSRAGVSRRTFYDVFDGREDCFLAAFDDAIGRIAEAVVPAWHAQGSWRERIRACLIGLLSFFDHDPTTSRLVVVESLEVGRLAAERRGRALAQLAAIVDQGRSEAGAGSDVPSLTAESVVGGVLSVLHARLSARTRQRLIELTGPLMWMIVLPYLGPTAARGELEWKAPPASDDLPRIASDPLRDLGMRVTYRTARVLAAVAASPGASNRSVGEAAGISDQGQISKLLARLTRLGLLENAIGSALDRGVPNAWTLTARGREVERSMRALDSPDGTVHRARRSDVNSSALAVSAIAQSTSSVAVRPRLANASDRLPCAARESPADADADPVADADTVP